MEKYEIRRVVPEDSESIIEMVKTLYGDRYGDGRLYQIHTVKEMIENGQICACVCVVARHKIISMEGYSSSECFDETAILRLKMTLPEYQQMGIGGEVTNYFMEQFDFSGYQSSYAGVLSYRKAPQIILDEYGYKMTGFFMNSYVESGDVEKRYKDMPKRSHIIMVRPEKKKNAGMVFAPQKTHELLRMIYENLDTEVQIKKDRVIPTESDSVIRLMENEKHFHQEILIQHSGSNLSEMISEVLAKRKQVPLQTFGVFLNSSEMYAVWAFEELERIGCFFCGFKPLGTVEYAVFYFSENVAVVKESLRVLDKYKKMKELIFNISQDARGENR